MGEEADDWDQNAYVQVEGGFLAGTVVLDPHRIPQNAHFFRLDGYRVVLLVSEVMQEVMERAGCRGAKFTEVSPRD